MIPSCIVGDFDSIRKEVQEYYEQRNVKLLYRYDQDYTDLEKCLYFSLEKLAENYKNGTKSNSIIILGSSGGRMDHTFSTYSQVLKYISNYSFEMKQTDIILISKSSLSIYLKPGINKLILPVSMRGDNRDYSVIPLLEEVKVNVHEVEENIRMSIIC